VKVERTFGAVADGDYFVDAGGCISNGVENLCGRADDVLASEFGSTLLVHRAGFSGGSGIEADRITHGYSSCLWLRALAVFAHCQGPFVGCRHYAGFSVRVRV
jgi:hypothetical protein